MKTYCIIIEPLSPFGTPLKGDTLFGQFCWQAAYDAGLLAVPFKEAIARYADQPFAVFSTAVPALSDGGFALKRPDAPLEQLFNLQGNCEEKVGNRKKLKGRRWLVCNKPDILADLRACTYLNDEQLTQAAGLAGDSFSSSAETGHNSISRLTGTTTGGSGFAPFTQENRWYAPGSRLALMIGIDETMLTIDRLVAGLTRIGQSGFGRDASTGLGKFSVLLGQQEINLAAYGATQPNALYTLAPCVPEPDQYQDALFTPFTRFGRHGDHLATSGKPYKNPVIMLDEGALLFPADMGQARKKPYLGTGLSGLSKIQETAVAQGYSLYIPVTLEVLQ